MSAVTVVVPVFNCAAYLPRCLQSLADQTLTDLQIVLVDDGSDDGSREIAAEFAANDQRFVLKHSREPGSGPAAARNIGLEAATGQALVFVDGDDYVPADALSILFDTLGSTDADVVIGAHVRAPDSTQRPDLADGQLQRVFTAPCTLETAELVAYLKDYLAAPNRHSLFTSSWARMFRWETVSQIRFDESLRTFEDVQYNFAVMSVASRVAYTPEVVYSHTLRGGYVSATMNAGGDGASLFGFVAALSELAVFLRRHWDNQEVEKRVGHALVTYAVIQLIRYTGQVRWQTFGRALVFHQKLISSQWLRRALTHYAPSTPAESRWVPRFMRWRVGIGTLIACYYKAVKRYG